MRIKLHTVGLAIIAAVISTAAWAQNNPGAAGSAIVRGKCSKLTVGGNELSRQCKGELASVTLGDGTIMFVFSTRDQLVAFHGDGRRVRPQPDGTGLLPTSFVSIGSLSDRPDVTKATGSCRFADPYAGRPAIIQCSAKSRFGQMSAMFRTNGRAPIER